MAPKLRKCPDPVDIINSVGDIRLHVKSSTGKSVYLVSSHQLISCSQFFSKMLSKSSVFAEAVDFRAHVTNPATIGTPFDLTIDIEERHQSSMKTILHIIHCRPHGLTRSADNADEWYEIARLADYFDCGQALRELANYCLGDWVSDWLFDQHKRQPQYLDKWIFTSEVVRDSRVFRTATKKAILQAYTIEKSDEIFWHVAGPADQMEGDVFTATNPVVLSAIMTTRESIAHKLADTIISIEQRYDGYPKVDSNNKKEWRCKANRDECDFMYSGAARYWITRLNLRCWSGSVNRMTLEQLADQISKIEFPSCAKLPGHTYGVCNPLGMKEFQLQPKVERVLGDISGLELSDFSAGSEV